MATIEEIRELKKQGKNREIIAALKDERLMIVVKEDAEKLLEKAWAHHQLGEYDSSLPIMAALSVKWSAFTIIGESARRGYAHGILQRDDDVQEADKTLQEIPFSLGRDNVRMNMMIMAARKGLTIPAEEVIATIMHTLQMVPYATVNGHIINNGALVLHEARQQKAVEPYIPILPGLIDVVIGIYEATDTAKNHIAAAKFRAAQICRANGWKKLARISIEESIELWRYLVASQDGARYKQNLEGAEKLKREMEKEEGISLI